VVVMMSKFDWNEHWEVTSENEEARKFAIKMADMIGAFLQNKRIGSVADYGCGPATCLFALAERFPQIEFYGFDVAASIIEKNSEKASELGIKNLSFKQDGLPIPRKERAYDLVICLATLHYIKEIELAIKNLLGLVNPKGYLIFNYPNTYCRTAYQRDIKPQDETMKQRFAVVLAGENLLSLKKISIALGSRPKKFYSSIKSNIYVLIHKTEG
jgi:trans-aconitate methyltransferase